MEPLTHLSFRYNNKKLLDIAKLAKVESSNYADPRYPDHSFNNWQITHYIDDYITSIMRKLEVEGKPRFYYLAPNSILPTHVDRNTTCSINFVLSKDPAPVTILGKNYFYKCGLLNTTIPHSVTNNNTERVLFKISIFNESYESLANRIKYKK